jgi:hypothetical protein
MLHNILEKHRSQDNTTNKTTNHMLKQHKLTPLMASKDEEIIAICYVLHFERTDVAYSYEWIGCGLISKIPNSKNKVKPGNEKLHSVSG